MDVRALGDIILNRWMCPDSTRRIMGHPVATLNLLSSNRAIEDLAISRMGAGHGDELQKPEDAKARTLR